MTDRAVLKFGPEPPDQIEGRAHIALSDHQTRAQISRDFVVGREHSSIATLEAEVEQIRRDLDEIVRRARARFLRARA
jgi:hypothetical protein